MHDHDLDLIASLAEGSLDDPAEARALVETCPECRHEYDTQVTTITALATMERVTMTDLERAALHRDLWSELRSQPVKKAATPWWYRLSYAAAGLFVVVGLVAVVSQLGGIGEETAETFADASSGLDESLQPLSEGGQEDSASTTIAAADAVPESTPDFETLATEARRQELPAAVRATQMTEDQADCLNAAGLEDQEVVGTVESDRTYLIAIPTEKDPDAETPVNFVDATTCEVAHVEE
jgi:hypothetical protein